MVVEFFKSYKKKQDFSESYFSAVQLEVIAPYSFNVLVI
jgi:hypothetical protein